MSGNRNRQKPPTAPWPAVLRPTRGIMDLLSLSFEVLGRCWPIIPLVVATRLAEIGVRLGISQLPSELRILATCAAVAPALIFFGFQSQVIQHLIFQGADQKRRRTRLSDAFAFGARTVLRGASMVVVCLAPTGAAIACLAIGILIGGGLSGLGGVLISAAMVIQVPWLALALFAPNIVAAEPCSPWQAFRQSRLLVYQNWLSLSLPVVAWFVIVMLVALTLRGEATSRVSTPTSLSAAALAVVLEGLLGVYSIVFTAVFYMSRRGRRAASRQG